MIEMNRNFDVAIIGAGPAGTACALALRNSGLNVALIDKSNFPRDKVCGDAIPGQALKLIRKLFDGEELEELEAKHKIQSSKFYINNSKYINIEWSLKAYNCKRSSFDDFMLNRVKNHTNVNVFEGIRIKEIKIGDRVEIAGIDSGFSISSDMIIGCDGANSIVSKLCNNGTDKNSYGNAIRAYYKKVDSSEDSNDFFMIDNIPGYFWIFPVGEHTFNVGLGLTANSSDRKLDIKKEFNNLIENNQLIKKKFENAELVSGPKGHRLPMWRKKSKISGERYMLVGDAASTIDPLFGHGVDKAIKGGMIAADQIIKCFNAQKFDSEFIAAYDENVHQQIGKQLKNSLILMRLFINNRIMVRIFSVIARNERLKRLIKKTFDKFSH